MASKDLQRRPSAKEIARRQSERLENEAVGEHYDDPTGFGLAEATRRTSMDVDPEADGTMVGEKEGVVPPGEEKMGWDSPEDPDNPRNWTNRKKWSTAGVTSFYTFVAPLASSMMAPGLPEIAIGYQTYNPTIVALSLSIYILAWGIGPLILAPLSEIYGRRWPLHICNIIFLAFTLACAWAPTMGSFIGFRFLAGLGGSAPIAIGGGIIADLWHERERASAMALYSLGPLIGPVLGPVAGGFIVQGAGFRWVFWVLSILAGIAAIIGVFLMKETYAPLLLAQRALRRDAEKGTVKKIPPPVAGHHANKMAFLLENLRRPIVLLFTSIICFVLSLYLGIVYGFLYLLFTTFPTLYSETYGWGPGISGLAYLGPGIGFLIATALAAGLMDRIYGKMSERNGGVGLPEYRIPVVIFGALFVPIGLFWYGWSAQEKAHWIVPIIGSGVFCFGMMLSFFPVQVYIIDSFEYPASALAAATLFRCLFGFAFPLFGEQMFARLGEGGGNSLLAGLALIIGIPFPVWLWFNGARLRGATGKI